MAKKQTRRSISVSRATYDRLKSFCEANGISMSQFVENRVGDALSIDVPASSKPVAVVASAPAPAPAAVALPVMPSAPAPSSRPSEPLARPASAAAPLTSAAARIAVEPPPPVIKPRSEQPAPKPAEKRPDQIFTF